MAESSARRRLASELARDLFVEWYERWMTNPGGRFEDLHLPESVHLEHDSQGRARVVITGPWVMPEPFTGQRCVP